MNSYKHIIKTTGIIGLVQVFKLIFGFIQNKVLAIIVGPAGFGVWGLLNSFVMMVSSFSTLGIDQAGVRQIAQNEDNKKRVSEIVWVFRNSILLLSTISTIFVIFFSRSISNAVFGNEDYYIGFIVVSFAILLNSVNQGQISILNGLRDIKSLAKSQIFGAIGGSVFAVIFVILYNDKGIPFFILSASLVSAFFSWIFVKQQAIFRIRPDFNTIRKDFSELISIGVGIAYSAIIVALMTYLIQIYIRKEFGISVVGIYNASFTLSNIYIGIILSAMGVDLMPRLSKVIKNEILVNKMVNDQMELGLLIASLGIIGVILFAPFILSILFSSQFISGVDIIRWQILGVFLRVLSFPLGYVLIIKKKTIQFVIVQTIMWVGNYLFLILFTKLWGIEVLGLNYFVAYVFYVFALYFFNKRDLIISKLLKKVFLISSCFIIIAWFTSYYLTFYYMISIGILTIMLNIYWIVYFLKKEMNINVFDFIKSKI